MDILKRIVLASIGVIDITREKVDELFDEMVKRGELTDDERAEAVKKFMDKTTDGADKIKDKVEDIFARCAEKCTANVTDQISTLGKRLEELTGRIEELEKKPGKK